MLLQNILEEYTPQSKAETVSGERIPTDDAVYLRNYENQNITIRKITRFTIDMKRIFLN